MARAARFASSATTPADCSMASASFCTPPPTAAEGFTPSTWRGVSVPKMPVRGMYLATHFQNYYQVAPIEEVTRYVEDLSLWGVNSFLVWFGMEEFNGINDPKAQSDARAPARLAEDRQGPGTERQPGWRRQRRVQEQPRRTSCRRQHG